MSEGTSWETMPAERWREARGRMLAKDKRIKHVIGSTWMVPSQSHNSGGYLVNTLDASCTCPDHEERRA